MPDNPPVSTTVPETVTIDTRADPESVATLNQTFTDFWKEEDAKSDAPTAPTAPAEGPAQETVKQAAKPGVDVDLDSKPEPKPAPPKATEAPPDIDKMELGGPNAPRQEHVEQFKKIKELWKADQRRAEEANKRLQAIETQLAEAKANAWTPEAKADYEHASEIRRRFDVSSDPVFRSKYDTPIQNQFLSVLEEAAQALPDRSAAIEWAEKIKNNWKPESLSRDWWLHDVVEKIPDQMERDALLRSVNDLLKHQKERSTALQQLTREKSAYENFLKEKQEFTHQYNQQEILAETKEQEKRIKDFLPVDVSQAKTPDERRAMEDHNERFQKLNKFYTDTLQDISSGPRGWARAAIEATRTLIMDQQITNLQQELKEVKTERDQLKTDMEKINGARRKITHAAPVASEPSKKNGQGLSLKDLSDPRKALSAYWEEVDRNTQ